MEANNFSPAAGYLQCEFPGKIIHKIFDDASLLASFKEFFGSEKKRMARHFYEALRFLDFYKTPDRLSTFDLMGLLDHGHDLLVPVDHRTW